MRASAAVTLGRVGGFGVFAMPVSYRVVIPDVFDGNPWGVIDYCMGINRGVHFFAALPEIGVRLEDGGRIVLFTPECQVLPNR